MREHRKAIRAAAMDLHRMATELRGRRAVPMPPDDPPGYIDAFSAAVRAEAHRCERASGITCRALKDQALAEAGHDLPSRRAAMALLVMVNLHASRAGVDPYRDA